MRFARANGYRRGAHHVVKKQTSQLAIEKRRGRFGALQESGLFDLERIACQLQLILQHHLNRVKRHACRFVTPYRYLFHQAPVGKGVSQINPLLESGGRDQINQAGGRLHLNVPTYLLGARLVPASKIPIGIELGKTEFASSSGAEPTKVRRARGRRYRLPAVKNKHRRVKVARAETRQKSVARRAAGFQAGDPHDIVFESRFYRQAFQKRGHAERAVCAPGAKVAPLFRHDRGGGQNVNKSRGRSPARVCHRGVHFQPAARTNDGRWLFCRPVLKYPEAGLKRNTPKTRKEKYRACHSGPAVARYWKRHGPLC
ncbi:hypothetical protein QKG26_gp072 [Chelonid alphaherpesvirus 5]|uniref:Uncharacterized protein n=1 Tax=Chelonid alphaherpesvirus 5 TaxID=702736 RepID=V5NXF3_9ALPH|nr:hypothetical protein QKG26_gp072 [Chelonid alphaherpesvirus 5]AHA93359.1 hypothetical protein [Chelonid alphaherpesvirus 5]